MTLIMISTDDCKKKLIQLYPDTSEKGWKRTSKYKNSQGLWDRIFKYSDGRETILQEDGDNLIEIQSVVLTPSIATIIISTNMTMERELFGVAGVEVLNTPYTSPNRAEIDFLLVLENSTNWNNPDKSRSSYDFAKLIDFKDFVQRCESQNIQLLHSYQEYIAYQIYHLYSLDEDSWSDISVPNYDDSMADLKDVIKRIKQGYLDNGLLTVLNPAINAKILSVCEDFSSTIFNYYEDEAEDTISFIKQFMKDFK